MVSVSDEKCRYKAGVLNKLSVDIPTMKELDLINMYTSVKLFPLQEMKLLVPRMKSLTYCN